MKIYLRYNGNSTNYIVLAKDRANKIIQFETTPSQSSGSEAELLSEDNNAFKINDESITQKAFNEFVRKYNSIK